MSAIWGAISLIKTALPKEISTVLFDAYRDCAIDRTEELCENHIYMGCGIQYFTKEAELEQLPCKYEKNWFTADVVLDNRVELINKLGINTDETSLIPDGRILQLMYQRHGNDCLNHLLGAYTFVNYCETSNQIDVVIDALGNRSVYYTIYKDVFYFSSLLLPLAKLTNAALNDRWLSDFIAMDHVVMINEAEETPYDGIYRVAPAHHLTIKDGIIHKERYWYPQKTVKELRLPSDEEYEKAFREVYFEAVRCTMRYNEKSPLSAMLSGGYDSTSVVAIASKLIKKDEKILTYTSVPLNDYKVLEDDYYVENESELVQKTAEYLGNLDPNFVDMSDIDVWNERSVQLKNIELPYKASQNLLWMTECMRQARQKGSGIMLTGSYGNTSVSFVEMDWYFIDLLTHFHFIKAESELTKFQRSLHFDKKYARKQILKSLIMAIKKAYIKETRKEQICRQSFILDSVVSKMNVLPRIDRFNRNYQKAMFRRKVQRALRTQDIELRQIGELEEKMSLMTGVLLRDPTRDKRVLEFCLSIPFNQFQKGGEERRLISVYLKDIMPPHILSKKILGKQSADFQYRLSLRWNEIRDEWMRNYQNTHSRYVDTIAAYEDLQKKPDINDYEKFDLVRHYYTQILLEFETNHKE